MTRRNPLRAAYLRVLAENRDLRAANADLMRDVDTLTDSLMPPTLCMCRYCQQERVEDEVLDRHPFAQMTPVGLGRAVVWMRT